MKLATFLSRTIYCVVPICKEMRPLCIVGPYTGDSLALSISIGMNLDHICPLFTGGLNDHVHSTVYTCDCTPDCDCIKQCSSRNVSILLAVFV